MNKHFVAVPIDTSLYRDLVRFLDREGIDKDPNDVIDSFLRSQLEVAMQELDTFFPELFSESPSDALKGYKWGPIFLPHGTLIRMRYRKQSYYAKIVGDELIYENQALSPSQFASMIANTSRNAWRDLLVRRPSDKDWVAADELRRKAKTISLDELDLEI